MEKIKQESIHFDPVVFTIRIYDQGTYEDRDPYSAVLTLTKMDDIAFMFAVQGKIAKDHWKQILLRLEEIGVKKLITKRHKQTKILNVETLLNRLLNSGPLKP